MPDDIKILSAKVNGVPVVMNRPTFEDESGAPINADSFSIPAPIQVAPKPLDLRRKDEPAQHVKFSTYVKKMLPGATGLARRAARQAIKSNNRWGRMRLIRKNKNEE